MNTKIIVNNEKIDVEWVCAPCERAVIDGQHEGKESVIDYDDFYNTHKIGPEPCAICGSNRGIEYCSRYAITTI